MPAALGRDGRAVSLPVAQAFGHASKETGAAAAEAFADARNGLTPKGNADSKGAAGSEGNSDSKSFPHTEANAGPEAGCGTGQCGG